MTKKRLIAFLMLGLMLMSMLSMPVTAFAAGFSSSSVGFKAGGTTYKVGSTSTGWKSKLGSYKRKAYDGCTAGTQSCMYTFSSKGVKVETLVKSKKESIISVIITGKSVVTAGGLKVGATVDKMTSIYGTGYKKSGTTYTYSSGGKSMVVKTSGSKVTQITLMK